VRRNSPWVCADPDWGRHSVRADAAVFGRRRTTYASVGGIERRPPTGMSRSRRREGENGGTDLEGPGVVSEGGEAPVEALDSC